MDNVDNNNIIMNNTQENQGEITYTMDYAKQTKTDIDSMLDKVEFSDDEGINKPLPLDQETYQREMRKIEGLYKEEEEEFTGTMNTYTGTKHEAELLKEIPLPFELSPNSKMLLCGTVNDIVEHKILLNHCKEKTIVNLDNIIFNKNNVAIGYIDDVIGNIDSPIYVVKIYPNLIDEKIRIEKGEEMFYCEQKASLVKKEDIIKRKGCDASNAFDEEISEDDMDYSDDDEEIQVKQMRRQKKKKDPYLNQYAPNKKFKMDDQQAGVQYQIMPQWFGQGQGQQQQQQQQKYMTPPSYVNPEYKFQGGMNQGNMNPFMNMMSNQSSTINQQQQQQINPNMMLMMNQMNFNNMINNAMQQGINPFARPNINQSTSTTIPSQPSSSLLDQLNQINQFTGPSLNNLMNMNQSSNPNPNSNPSATE